MEMIKSLTVFRFITAFVVFIFHCYAHIGFRLNIKVFDAFFKNGAVFMTGFFVLSGFIMAHVYGNVDFSKQKNILSYYVKRFAKIYPAYVISTIVYFLIFHNFSAKEWARIIINDIFLIQAFFPSMFSLGINGGTWSLTVEAFLYFLFPFIILLSRKSPKLLMGSLLLALIVSINVTINKADYVYANPIFRIPDFCFGMGCYFIKDKIRDKKYLLYVSMSVLVIATIFLGKASYFYMKGQFLVIPLFGLWITSLFYTKSKIYNNRVLEYFGLVSYSFYLWQFVAIKLGSSILKARPEVNMNLLVLLLFIVNLVLAIISYHFIEEKFRKFILSKFLQNTSKENTKEEYIPVKVS